MARHPAPAGRRWGWRCLPPQPPGDRGRSAPRRSPGSPVSAETSHPHHSGPPADLSRAEGVCDGAVSPPIPATWRQGAESGAGPLPSPHRMGRDLGLAEAPGSQVQHGCSEQGAQASWDPPCHLSARSGQGAPRTSGCQAWGSAAFPTPLGWRLWFGIDPEVRAPPRPSVRSAGPGICVCTTSLGVCPWPPQSCCSHTALPSPPPGATWAQLPRKGPGAAGQLLARPPFLGVHGDSRGFPKNTGNTAAPTLHPGLQLPPPSPSPWPHPRYEQRPSPPSLSRGPAVFWMPPRRSRDSQGRFGTQDRRDRMGATTHHGGTPAWRAHAPLTHPRPFGPGIASSCREPSRLQSEGRRCRR